MRDRIADDIAESETRLVKLLAKFKALSSEFADNEELLASYYKELGLLEGRSEFTYLTNEVLLDVLYKATNDLEELIYNQKEKLDNLEWDIEVVEDQMKTRLYLEI
jgi:hypothetical protein